MTNLKDWLRIAHSNDVILTRDRYARSHGRQKSVLGAVGQVCRVHEGRVGLQGVLKPAHLGADHRIVLEPVFEMPKILEQMIEGVVVVLAIWELASESIAG